MEEEDYEVMYSTLLMAFTKLSISGTRRASSLPYVSLGLLLATRLAVPDSKSRNIPEVVLVRRWAVGILGIWRGGVGWVKGGAVGVSLQAT